MSGQFEQGDWILLSMVAGFLLQGAIYGQLIKDDPSTSVGLGKGFKIAGIQFAIGIGILILKMAEKEMKEINEAYDYFKKKYNFK